ncbi:MAG: transcriptional regulator [Ruminococcus sp.]|nr:transcriptional regulator [Ruminococcus sp.]MBQ9516239.1 transcriptional regulator [Ruminococcus sp.]
MNEQLKSTLFSLAHTIAAHYGKSCEVAVHDLTDDNAAEHSIIYIENGEVTGRAVGDGASSVVLEQLSGDHPAEDRVGYFTKTSDGKILKSSTTYIRDENGRVIAIFSINHDITALSVASAALTEMVRPSDNSGEVEKITPHVGELLDELLWKSTELIGKPVSMMNKDDKMRAIRYLNSKGALLITKSGDKIAKYFGISKFTLYSYIDVKQEEEQHD